MAKEQKISTELQKISGLLRDTTFALEMAKSLEQSYYTSLNQTPPDFLPPNADSASIPRSVKEEKIATSIAPFYALECALGFLIEQKGGTPIEWLSKIKTGELDSTEVLVVNRFANATWKAGQPFRGLKRITRDIFISAALLPEIEVKKDFDQISSASVRLLNSLQDVKDSAAETQVKRIRELLQDKQFAFETAKSIDAFYYQAQQLDPPPFLKPGEDTAIIKKSPRTEKVATNIAGFYALECGLSFLATAQNKIPSEILHSIVTDSLDNSDKRIFERFANATWKAGQPFRGLDRITRDNFISFSQLSPEEIEKDWVQIKAAASRLGDL